MINKRTILALIPARSGSKRLPGKNIRKFCNKPLIARTIEAAKKIRYIDKVVVSTDSNKIATIASRYGAEVPFLRPAKLSTDKAKMIDAIFHAMHFLKKQGNSYDILILLQPTSPLRSVNDVNRALQMFIKKNANAVVSVSSADHNSHITNSLPNNLSMEDFVNFSNKSKNFHNNETLYQINGALYIVKWNFLKKNKDWFSKKTYAFIMKKEHSVDIDDEIDFLFAETLARHRKTTI